VLNGGGGGFDWVMYNTSTTGLTVDLTNPGLNSGDAAGDSYVNFAFISIWGSNFADTLRGDGGSNHLMGGGGADVLDGMGGSDFADYGNSSGAVRASLAAPGTNNGEAFGDTYFSIENLWGSGFNDILIGDGGDNELQGQAGADQLDGGGGIDTATYQLSSAGVVVNLTTGTGQFGDAAGDTLINFENLRGSEFDDTLIGSGTNNLLEGLGGNDRMVGAGGADTFTGGSGNDTFVWAAPADGGVDVITDFVSGSDALEVLASGFGGGLVAGAAPTVLTGAFASVTGGASGYFIFDNTDPSGGTVYYDANGGSGADATAFVKLNGVFTLLPSDFHVV